MTKLDLKYRVTRGNSATMSSRDGRRFIVEIPASEIKKIFSWVLKCPAEETGGDLFGLWDEGQHAFKNKLNIHHVIGPGNLCRRTTFLFHQDVRYSSRIATYLSEQHSLDHVAVWHSHQSALDRPSAPDEEAIWNTMPSHAINRFALFIASIVKKSDNDVISSVAIKCFLFEIDERTNECLPVLQGKFQILPEQSKTVCFGSDLEEYELDEGAENFVTDEELKSLDINVTETSVVGSINPITHRVNNGDMK